MIVLCAYGPGRPPEERTRQSIAAWRRYGAVPEECHAKNVRILYREVAGDTGYEDLVRELWGQDDLLIWERDIVAPPEAVSLMALCPVGRCALTYPYHAGTLEAHAGRVGSAWKNVSRPGGSDPVEVKVPEMWADRVGLGLTFIRWQRARKVSLDGMEPGDWRTFDTRLMLHLYQFGWRWHVHWNPLRGDGLIEHLHTVHSHEARRVEVVHAPPAPW